MLLGSAYYQNEYGAPPIAQLIPADGMGQLRPYVPLWVQKQENLQRGIGLLSGLGQTASTSPVGQTLAISARDIATKQLTSAMSAFGISATVAIPIIGAAVAAITFGINALFNRKGPKQKVATTKIVETVEPKMNENLEAYLAGPRTKSSQAQALANFDAMWAWLEQQCSDPQYGEPGERCINDRKEGACKWKTKAGYWEFDQTAGQYKWHPAAPYWCGKDPCNAGNDCVNFFTGLRDPIADDPGVVPDPVLDKDGNLVQASIDPTTGEVVYKTFDQGGGSVLGGSMGLILAGALIVGAFVIGGEK